MTRFFAFALLAMLAAAGACDRGKSDARQASPASEDTPGDNPADTRMSGASPTSARAGRARTNVLLITLDTVRADALGVYGQPRVVTPHIDAFAEGGVLFEDCVSSSPSTLPSHASIFTGRHPYAHGVRANAGYALGESELTLAETLRSHGYRTRAEISSEVMTARARLDQGFESYHDVEADDVALQRIRTAEGTDQHESVLMVRQAADISRHGIRFLETVRLLPEPFFLWLHYFDPHRPHAPPSRFLSRFPDDPYLAEVAYVDHSVGDVLTALVRLDLADDTLVVITSDHGEGFGEHGEHSHSFFLYDTTIRVPLIVRGPAVDAGKRVAALVRSVDIAPTILDLLELPPLTASQGVSLRALMEGREIPPLTGYGESIELLKAFGSPVLRFVREGRWKYIHTSPPELYDLASDPFELDNAAPREPERSAAMRVALGELLQGATTPEAPASPIDAATQARLEALGYLVGRPSAPPEELASLALDDPPQGYSLATDVLQLNLAKGAIGTAEGPALFRDLRTRHPESAELLRGLVAALHGLDDAGDISQSEITALLEQALKLDADNALLFVRLAELSARAGSLEEAVSALRLVLKLEPCAGPPRSTLVNLLHDAKRHYQRFEIARQGVLQCPNLASALNDMAWVLATSTVDELRDGAQAVDLAERALAAEPGKPGFRDTLAAAHAETGDFERAAAILREIIPDLERMRAPSQAIAEFRQHLAAFEAGRPLRE